MKVLLCLCTVIAASSAGFIGYPVAPIAYPTYTSVLSPPLTTVARPFVTYTGLHGHPFALAPSYFSYNIIPNNVVLTGVPGVVHYLPVAPPNGKGKPGKKPGDKKEGGDKDTKEETTEKPKAGEGGETTTNETEDLA